MQKMPLTPKQLKVLQFLKAFYNENEFMPSYREIAENFDLKSTNSVFDYLNRLDQKGYIKRFKVGRYGGTRALELISD